MFGEQQQQAFRQILLERLIEVADENVVHLAIAEAAELAMEEMA